MGGYIWNGIVKKYICIIVAIKPRRAQLLLICNVESSIAPPLTRWLRKEGRNVYEYEENVNVLFEWFTCTRPR